MSILRATFKLSRSLAHGGLFGDDAFSVMLHFQRNDG